MSNLKQLDHYRVANGFEGLSAEVSNSYKKHMLGPMDVKGHNKMLVLGH